ncbi:hypothetical protein O0544_17875 [Edwardsiella anguillarum]|nr:hypothetical protein [Edwardsiella anguillarum]
MCLSASFWTRSIRWSKRIRSDYLCREDNINYLKGKLNTTRHLRKNIIHKQRFFCEYDAFLTDRPANRLLHSALNRVVRITRHAANQKRLQELLHFSTMCH